MYWNNTPNGVPNGSKSASLENKYSPITAFVYCKWRFVCSFLVNSIRFKFQIKNGHFMNFSFILGLTGEKGIHGEKGILGPVGDKGPNGISGDKGLHL